jgi:hypothetical protein
MELRRQDFTFFSLHLSSFAWDFPSPKFRQTLSCYASERIYTSHLWQELAFVRSAEIMVVPSAKVEMKYDLSIRFIYPARLFYGERQLAEVTN